MNGSQSQPLVTVDVGNSRIKLGLFAKINASGLPEPVRTLELAAGHWEPEQIGAWLGTDSNLPCVWRIASVYRDASARLGEWVRTVRGGDKIAELTAGDLPLRVALPAPERVGMDRLLGAVAANRLRTPGQATILVDLGSAITVDVVSHQGEFIGGAILPGIAMSAQALHERTDLLPSLPINRLDEPPPVLGTSTTAAIESGLYWGAIGAVRELIRRLSADWRYKPQVFLTGGAAPSVAALLAEEASYVPHLVLAGIAITHATER